MQIDIKLHKEDLPDQITFDEQIAIDCEMSGLSVDRDKLCLVQISSCNNDAHIVQLNRENYKAPNLKKLLRINKMKIAVVGSGISGLGASLALSEKYEVSLFEKNNYFGGHSNTHSFKFRNSEVNIDTGFIVFNEINYPNLCSFFKLLNVNSYESDMSFSVSMNKGKLEYSGSSLLSISSF